MIINLVLACFSGAWEYIESTCDQVCDLERRVHLAKVNVETICNIMAAWSEVPLYKRKDGKKDCLLNLEVLNYSQKILTAPSN